MPGMRRDRAGAAPSDVLDLRNWYVGIPVATRRPDSPDIIGQPRLTGFSDRWFHVTDDGTGVVCTANAGGATTRGSRYPRTELREMAGAAKAAWDSAVGTHALQVTEAITRTTPNRPHMIAAQIHDTTADVMQIRLQGSTLMVRSHDPNGGNVRHILDDDYRLGAVFTIRIVASAAGVQVFHDGSLATTIPVAGAGWYFKTGAYLQSNADYDAPDALGSVVLYDVQVAHSAPPRGAGRWSLRGRGR
jgi:poly(beta-D-mannuronate) lyase